MKYLTLIFCTFLILSTGCSKLDPAQPGNLVPATVMEDPTIPSVRLSSTTLHVRRLGDPEKPKLFVLEGGPGDDFRYLLDLDTEINGRRLSDDYELIFHDYRGCGLSQRHPLDELTMAHSLTDLEELVDRFAPDEPISFIGHSHGAVVATQYLNEHPERVGRIVLIEPGALSVKINENLPAANDVNLFGPDLNRILWAKQMIGLDNHASADYFFGLARINSDSENRGESCPSLNYRGGAAAALAIAIDEVNDGDYDFTTKLDRYPGKVLFISSDESDLGYDFQQANQVDLFPNSEHRKVEGTGHNGLINCRTGETVGLIRAYLEEVD
ncbi:alpha/beta fold hydrolase [Lewinella sp. IMCC34191]|uniref:alpha/beta fold hydrolase n=1 Tax=Lewinella sp. IMCC34191 TaxID=2259172 RepID=UPI000E2376E7|nr:alpha/beta hydrolase [Lewinella sp. IMCC34191]